MLFGCTVGMIVQTVLIPKKDLGFMTDLGGFLLHVERPSSKKRLPYEKNVLKTNRQSCIDNKDCSKHSVVIRFLKCIMKSLYNLDY